MITPSTEQRGEKAPKDETDLRSLLAFTLGPAYMSNRQPVCDTEHAVAQLSRGEFMALG